MTPKAAFFRASNFDQKNEEAIFSTVHHLPRSTEHHPHHTTTATHYQKIDPKPKTQINSLHRQHARAPIQTSIRALFVMLHSARVPGS